MFYFLAVAPFDFANIFGNVSKRWYYYAALLIVLTLITLSFLLNKKKRDNLTSTQRIVYVALCSAVCFIANYFTINVSEVLQVSFVALAGFIAGYLLGGSWGFIASFVGDLICGILHPFGAYNPIIGIGNGLFGLIPGVIFSLPKGKDYIKVIISQIIAFITCSFLVNTVGLSLMYSITFYSLMILLPYKLITAVVNAILCIVVVRIFPKILPKDKFFINKDADYENNVKSR